MFRLIALIIWTAMNVYVFWRAASIPLVRKHVPAPVLGGAAFILWSSFMVSRFISHHGANALSRSLEVLAANWLGILFLLLVCFLALDLVTLFGFVFSRMVPALRGWALLAGLVLSAIAFIQGRRAPVVENYEVVLPNLPRASDGTVIVFVSDLHVGSILGPDWLQARIRQIEAERPDIIILGGDIVEGHDSREFQLLELFRRLSAPAGVWAVTGNHEFYGARVEHGKTALDSAGFRLLHDTWTEVKPGLVLAGVDDLTIRRRAGQSAGFITQALAGRPPQIPVVLVSHSPLEPDEAARAGVGLMLSGHTHAGQIWPFRYVVALTLHFVAGRYDVHGMPLIVCRGTGTWGPRMRLWQRGEILRITLKSA